VAEEVRMRATLRSANNVVRDTMIRRVKETIDGVCAAYGATGELEVKYGYAALINDDGETDRVARVAESLLGEGSVRWKEKPSMGVEDFSFFLQEARGAFYHLGCAPGDGTSSAPLHSSQFYLDEDCLPLGAALQASLCLDALRELGAK